MNTLNYETRKQMIFNFLYKKPDSVLRRYRAPDYLGDDQLRAEVNDLVEEINREIPDGYTAEDFKSLMPEIHRSIRRHHTAQSWPPAKTFIAATKDAARKVSESKARAQFEANPQGRNLDPYELMAKRMKAGESVAETFLWGQEAVEMTDRDLIDTEILDKYRKSAYAKKAIFYGREEADQWLARVEARHNCCVRH